MFRGTQDVTLPQLRVLDYQELIVCSGDMLKASNLPLSVSILTTLSTAVKIQMRSTSETKIQEFFSNFVQIPAFGLVYEATNSLATERERERGRVTH